MLDWRHNSFSRSVVARILAVKETLRFLFISGLQMRCVKCLCLHCNAFSGHFHCVKISLLLLQLTCIELLEKTTQ